MKSATSFKSSIIHAAPMLGFGLICGVILSIWAPFGTQNLSALGRTVFWVGLCTAGSIGAALIDGILALLRQSPTTAMRVFYQSVGATILVSALLVITFPHSGAPFILMTVVLAWTVSYAISWVGMLIRQKAEGKDVAVQTEGTSPEVQPTPSFTRRLPLAFKDADILALTSEDHYVRVITDQGSSLILMRLSDAIDELAAWDGVQTHRSWWVARQGIDAVSRKGRTAEIRLKGSDMIVPVSRSGLARLKEKSWI